MVAKLVSVGLTGTEKAEWEALAPQLRPPVDGRTALVAEIPNVLPWSAERPHLYPLHVTLRSPAGEAVEEADLRIGFRRVEIKGVHLLINGAVVLINGVNERTMRAVTHYDVDRAACAEALPAAEPEAQATLHLLRSQALAALSRKDEALAEARGAVQTAPGRLDVQWNLAQRLTETGMDREAQFVYKMLLQQLPGNAPERGRIAEEYYLVLQRMQASAPGVSP